jgi:threonine dehydrogenase-like Zn-dependent dehydrogenase
VDDRGEGGGVIALTYTPTPARYLVAPASALKLEDIRPPRLPGPGWHMVKPRLSGICGSDQALLAGKASLHLAALTSTPFVPGHEIVGELLDNCEDLPAGTRVVMDSVLTCAARGVEPCEGCASGATNRCDRITVGHVTPGLQTGFCHDTGGGWGNVMVAHRSQLYAVPDGLSDERAVLVEPLAGAVHTALRAKVEPGQSVLVSGAGAVGLFATLALRELTQAGRITVVAKHAKQRELARAFGASDVVAPDEVFRGVRRATGAFRLKPELGAREFLLGGVDVAVDAVGSKDSIDTVLRVTKAGGRVVLSGMPSTGAEGAERPARVRDRPGDRREGAARRDRRRAVPTVPVAGGPRPRPVGGPARHGQGGFRCEGIMTASGVGPLNIERRERF